MTGDDVSADDTKTTRIAMLIYQGFTTLDLIGPQQVLAGLPDTTIDLVAKCGDPVLSDTNVSILPDRTFAQCEADYDVLVVPGAAAIHRMVEDRETLAFVRKIADGAKFITSVCTGSLILGAAGLLTGYRAASHWAFRDFLANFGAIPDDSRIVIDGNRITGGGVTAGVDFGLQLAATLAGEEDAKLRQLVMEYVPDPPFDCGTPARADAETLARATQRLAPSVAAMKDAAGRFVAAG